MERYDIARDRWLELKTELNEGRYHATACLLQNRYIYVFGGYKTTHFTKSNITRVNRKIENMDNVSMNIIEKYDTWNDLEDENWAKMSKIQNQRYKAIGMNFKHDIYDSSGASSSDPAAGSGSYDKNRKYCERVYIKRDQINNVGNLIVFPLCPSN